MRLPASRGLFAALVLAAAAAHGEPAPASGPGSASELYRALFDERAGSELPPLAVDRALERAAEQRVELLARRLAEQGTEGGSLPRVPGSLRGTLFEAGYAADRVEAMHVLGADTLRATLLEILGNASSFRDAFFGTELTDLGIGAASVDGRSVYVVLLALSKARAFSRGTEGLESLEAVRGDLLERINDERESEGVRRLERSPCLEGVAQAFAERLLAGDFFDHVTPEGETLMDRLSVARCSMREASENLAKGPASVPDAIQGWLDSPSHRRALLDTAFRQVGYGLAFGPTDSGFGVIWVQVLGRPF
jgi:uncharacterized protein YkwD